MIRRLLFGALVLSCSRTPDSDSKPKVLTEKTAAEPPRRPTAKPERERDSLELLDLLARCDVDPKGVFLDLGSAAAQGVTGWWSFGADPTMTDVERDGETWARISGRKVVWRFVLDEPAPLVISMRARGMGARNAAVSLDGKPLGTLALSRPQSRVATAHSMPGPVPPGAHAIELRFFGSRAQGEPAAEIDWVRAATAEEAGTFAPPTMTQIVSNAALGGVPHRAVALRAASSLRCPLLMPADARLELSLGFEGAGGGDAELVVLRDGEPPALVRAEHVEGGDHAEWRPLQVALPQLAGKVATVELRAKSSSQGGRLLFGDPTIRSVETPRSPVPTARLVVVVALAGVNRARLMKTEPYASLAELARTGVTFLAHRAPTTVSASVIASLLTGRSAAAHGMEDTGARMPGNVTTLSVAGSEGSVQTAMFSGCPTTFEPFGFSRGWDKYATFSPVEGAPAVAPITEALRWTTEHMKSETARALVVVHARGGHPPWDVTMTEAGKLAPFDYSGPMEPRRAAQLIARARPKHSRFRLNESDRTRMWALYEMALAGQDRALDGFIEGLKRAGLWDQTLFVVTGDVSIPDDSRTPFGDGEDLGEELLSLPLYVHFPQGALAGVTVSVPTSIVDISRSALDALALPIPEGFEGADLFAVARGNTPPGGRPLLATLGSRYSLRLGDFVLSGTDGKPPQLCDLSADPGCETDRAEKLPRTAALLFRMAYDAEMAADRQKRAREPATIDATTAAALQVWGESEPRDEESVESRR